MGFIISFILTLFFVPFVRNFCLKKGYVDKPGARKIHRDPIPRLGGVAIWAGTIITFWIIVALLGKYPHGNCLSGILIGASIMFLLGLVDDIYDLPASFKFVIQIGAALIAVLLGVKIDVVWNPVGNPVMLGAMSVPITVFWIVGISNAMNFIDGMDGLAGAVSTIGAVSFAVIALSSIHPSPISAMLAVVLAGAMMGFLMFNFKPAKIFMGDSGALFTGFLLSSLSVVGVMKTAAFTIFLPVFIFLVPILDITYSTVRRLMKGHSPFVADAEHIHHKLLSAGFSQDHTVFILITLAVAAGAVASIFVNSQEQYFWVIFSVLLFMTLTLRLSKIFFNSD